MHDIPDHYIYKDKVLKWEKQYWKNQIKSDTPTVYKSNIDNTFTSFYYQKIILSTAFTLYLNVYLQFKIVSLFVCYFIST